MVDGPHFGFSSPGARLREATLFTTLADPFKTGLD